MREADEGSAPSSAVVDRPSMEEVDAVADMWVDLAASQRAYRSHIRGPENRGTIRDAMARHVVTDGLRVARIDDEIVGFVMFGLERGEYVQDVTRGVVRNIYVEPSARNRGVGSKLLSTAERELRDADADAITLDVMAGNEEARRFYEQHGYSPHRVEIEKRVESDTHSKED
ncbi:GNAT family N-acetyltransferase [Halopelagius fulvigenes]|uniref:GNAT family N-acetyltransferase n=1 Tax=Halopelagius fulvigenes TaxID=1198324 RepID=A0ABD5TYF9_9EURY